MIKTILPLLGFAVMTAACAPKDETKAPPPFTGTTVELPVTSEVLLPEKGVAYAFVPNDVATWLSQIIILSEDGGLYQATTDTRVAKPIRGPKAKSIIGISRPGAPGIFLAIDAEGGRIHGYIEANDAGDFKHIGVVDDQPGVKAFCAHAVTPSDTFAALLENGSKQDISFEIYDETVRLAFGKATPPSKVKLSCSIDEAGVVSWSSGKATRLEDIPTSVSLQAKDEKIELLTKKNLQGLMIGSNKYPFNTAVVKVTSGITIPGVKNPQSVYTASENFGGPFNNGLILVSDGNEPRFVVISADFARKTLTASAP